MSVERQQHVAAHIRVCPRCQQLIESAGAADNPATPYSVPTASAGHCAAAEPKQPPGEDAETHPGQLGPYQLLEPLGRGGMGVVYRAVHTRLQRQVALKLLPVHGRRLPQAVARFQREMVAAGQLDHPNLVRATDAGEWEGYPFLVMDFVDGLDIGRLLLAHGPLRIADACEIIRQAALGLEAAAASGLVHRDIKPSNLMLTPEGRVKVLDLGLALLRAPAGNSELTSSEQILGTADYMAPEQADAAHAVDSRADIYSLGCTLYKLLCGRVPFGGPQFDSTPKKLKAHALLPPPPLAQRRRDVPQALLTILDRMLAKDPEQRYARPVLVAQALEPLARGSNLQLLLLPVSGSAGRTRHVAAPAVPVSVRVRRRPAVRAVAALGLAGLLTTALIVLLQRWHAEGPPEAVGPPGDQLQQPARPALWPVPLRLAGPAPAGESHWQFNEEKWAREHVWEVTATAKEALMLRLGQATQPSLHFEVRIQLVIDSVGAGFGLFFGYRDVTGLLADYRRRYQLIAALGQRGANPEMYWLERRVRSIRHANGLGTTEPLGQLALGSPGVEEHRLEIEVRAGRLCSVTWDGREVPPLADPPPLQPLAPQLVPGDYAGEVGIFAQRCVVRFRNPIFSSPR